MLIKHRIKATEGEAQVGRIREDLFNNMGGAVQGREQKAF